MHALQRKLAGGMHRALRHALFDDASEEAAVDGTMDHGGARPPADAPTAEPRPARRPAFRSLADWVEDVLVSRNGVVAALPARDGIAGRVVALDASLASGNAMYWSAHLLAHQDRFTASKVCLCGSSVHASVVTLQNGPLSFMPEGDVYGMRRADLDVDVDAGFTAEVLQRSEARAKDVATMLLMAEAGVAPPVLAVFVARRGSHHPDSWLNFAPTHLVAAAPAAEARAPSSIVIVSKVYTFSLGDLINAAIQGTSAGRERAADVLRDAVPLVMKKVRELSALRQAHGVVKVDMTTDSIVFCADLQPSGESWTLGGVGHLATSREHLNGTPKIKGYTALFSRRMREEEYDADSATVLHSLLLLSFAREVHGIEAEAALRGHVLSDDSFQKAARAASSRKCRLEKFLGAVATRQQLHSPGLHAAMLQLAEQALPAILRAVPSEATFTELVHFVLHSKGDSPARDDAAALEHIQDMHISCAG